MAKSLKFTMSKKSESERLAEAVTALAGTILEIVNEKVKLATEARGTVQAETPSNPTQPAALEGWVRKKQLALHYNVSLRTVDNWIKKGMVPHIRLSGRNLRFKPSEVDEALSRSHKRHARW